MREHDRRWERSKSKGESWQLGGLPSTAEGPGSQSCLLNASLRGTQRELCPNGFLARDGEGGRSRPGESGKSRKIGGKQAVGVVRNLKDPLAWPVTLLSYMVASQGGGTWGSPPPANGAFPRLCGMISFENQ